MSQMDICLHWHDRAPLSPNMLSVSLFWNPAQETIEAICVFMCISGDL